ncbi:MAG: NAD(P)/FAD-dependent oxidoreductase [Pseudomonadota bacterium]
MKIAILGAGFAGIATARTLSALNHQVTVFESESEVGGVWASSRRYPGLCTQNPGDTYHFSEIPLPKDYPEWPSGEQMQAYIQSCVAQFGLNHLIRLETRVEQVSYNDEHRKWTLHTASSSNVNEPKEEHEGFDFLVIANGIFSQPNVPAFAGEERWLNAGGKLLHTSELIDLEQARDKDVLVLGYGKSSCDAACAASKVSRHTTVVTRHVIWKIPRKIAGVINFKHLFLTRLGEGLFPWAKLKGFDSFIHGRGKPLRNLLLAGLQKIIESQFKLRERGLHPNKPLESVARTSVSLATNGFFEAVATGDIRVARETTIEQLTPGKALLSNGDTVDTDLIIAGTGFRQTVPVLPPAMMNRLLNEDEDFMLYRGILPIDIPGLAFIGYNSSLMCPLICEASAMWLAEYLRGGINLPAKEDMQTRIEDRLAFHKNRMDGNYFHGTYLVPFSIRPIDELLDDIDLNVGQLEKGKQWLRHVKPTAYAHNYQVLQQRAAITSQSAPVGSEPYAESTQQGSG